MRKRVSVLVHGRVQGVGFRWSCRREADRLGIDGWVRNRMDGTVEILAQGDPDSVHALVEWCRSGPSGARVSRVDVADDDGTTRFFGFEITR